jgi:hypothetical protein
LLHKSGSFVKTQEAQEAFEDLKYLTSPPVMVAPDPSEPLLLYAAATVEVIRVVLVVERHEQQLPKQVTVGQVPSPSTRLLSKV